MGNYYKVDTRKLSLRELWNIKPTWKILIPWIAGRFGISLNAGSGFKLPDAVAEIEVPENEFGLPARASLQPALDEALKYGCSSPRYYSLENLGRDNRTSFISLLHRSGEFSIRLMHTMSTKVHPPVENRLTVLMSELNDGTYFVTSDSKPKFRPTPGVRVHRLIGAPVAQLLEAHEKHLTEIRWQNPAKPSRSLEAMDDAWNRYEKFSTQFGIQRGLYLKMSPEEVASEQEVVAGAQAETGDRSEHFDVLLELNRLQNKKAGLGSVIWILVVSGLLFILAGAKQWSWNYLLILLPILFVHELGHYLAMRTFHYRNLRMFFIPFFGAAVSGQHFNVPGWKKVIVSLMGPLPGILLGALLGAVGYVFQIAILKRIAVMAVMINGFNLLPILPMDGGWIFHALVFSRHYLFDTVFRVLAALGLFALGLLTQSKILTYLGIPMLMVIPMNYQMGRIAADLRKRGLPPTSEDAQTIPAETAQVIIAEVKKTMPKNHTHRMVAQRTLQIFEMLNAKPPGWGASLGLLMLHLGSLGLAVVMMALLFMGSRFSAERFAAVMAIDPSRPLSYPVRVWNEHPTPAFAKSPVTIVAHCASRLKAGQAFSALTNQVAASATLQCWGETVLLTLPAEAEQEKRWLKQLKSLAKITFIDRSNAPALFTLSCRFQSKAGIKAVEEEMEGYLNNDFTMFLIPPYLPNDGRTPEQRAAHRLARLSFHRARQITSQAQDDSRLKPLRQQIRVAAQKQDSTKVDQLQDKLEKLTQEIVAERRARLKKGEDGPVDATMLDLFSEYSANLDSTNSVGNTNTAMILTRMGGIPPARDPEKNLHPYAMRSGIVFVKDTTLTLTWSSFAQLAQGVPMLLDWLTQQGATELKYNIGSGEVLAAAEED